MKKIAAFSFLLFLILFVMPANSQSDTLYQKEWKEVENQVQGRLPKSALTLVEQIYEKAQKANQQAQVIKALVYMANLQQENTENSTAISLQRFTKELNNTTDKRSKAILHNIIANIYYHFFQNNRWNLYNRTNTTNFIKEDVNTWSRKDFHEAIRHHYLLSLEEKTILQQTKLSEYDVLINKGNMRHLRPSLYDLLAHNALAYFQNDEINIDSPTYAFSIQEAPAFSPAAQFIQHKFVTKDTLSSDYTALTIWQELLIFHLNDKDPSALIDADILRLGFMQNKSVLPAKDSLYLQALNQLISKFPENTATLQAKYLLALSNYQKGQTYRPYSDSTYRMHIVKAKEELTKIAANKDSSEGKANSINLLHSITESSLQLSIEKVNSPQLPFRIFVKYKNLNQLYLRVIRINEQIKKALENKYDNEFFSILAKQPAVKNWTQQLPDPQDFQQHATEIKADALPSGEYMLLVNTNPQFTTHNSIASAEMFYVSGISYIQNNNNLFILDRETGNPLVNATVVLKNRYGNKEIVSTLKSDKNGKVTIPTAVKNNSYDISIAYLQDKLNITNDWISVYNRPSGESNNTSNVFLFTDRSIYRPGQMLYFKGIAVANNQKIKNSSVIIPNQPYTVALYNANGQKVDSLTAKTNEFGSLQGKFNLPTGVLNGQFSVRVTQKQRAAGTVYISVEEYKRPKFFVEYTPIQGTYTLNDSIILSGNAKAYAGNNIDGAVVKYRVVRETRFPYPWLLRWWPAQGGAQEIVNGETTTNENGSFAIRFTALPDVTVQPKTSPVFHYTVYADVTDINGETRSASTTIKAGYQSLLLQANIPAQLTDSSLKELNITTTNMNDHFEAAPVHVSVQKITPEERLIRNRYWSRPDQFTLTETAYRKLFPHDEYDNESAKESWKRSGIIYEQNSTTQENGKIAFNGKLSAGLYAFSISLKDKSGNDIKEEKIVEITTSQNKKILPAAIWSSVAGSTLPGNTAEISLGTGYSKTYIIQQENKIGAQNIQEEKYSYLTLDNSIHKTSIPIKEEDRGGFGLSWIFIKNNRIYTTSENIIVPWNNKQLNIEFLSHRDKALPGSEEKWKVKISGMEKDKVAAEMLVSMYDASLDQFTPHYWNIPSIWNNHYSSTYWNGRQNFTSIQNYARNFYQNKYAEYRKEYDRLSIIDHINYSPYARNMVTRAASSNVNAILSRTPGLEVEAADMENVVVAGFSKSQAGKADSLSFNAIEETAPQNATDIQVRSNFNETAFFFPQLTTDEEGNISFNFTLPDATTRWKLQTLAHTKDLKLGYNSTELITQKELMVQTNAPRFFRENDKLSFTGKLVNLSEVTLSGTATLELLDPVTGNSLNSLFKLNNNSVPYTVTSGNSTAIQFPIEIPANYQQAVTWRIIAKATKDAVTIGDGEENSLPVLSNKILVTESLPLYSNNYNVKGFKFDQLLASGKSNTLSHQSLTVEYTSNPAWYAIQALPYLMEYPYDCAEQTWNRFYANALATHITSQAPRVKAIFEKWATIDTSALRSNLEKNQELKNILLEETPWVLAAKNESEQKRNIALLFDAVKMSQQLNSSMEKLAGMQLNNGAFPWFKDGQENLYITQYILSGMGHLKHLNALSKEQLAKVDFISKKALVYTDQQLVKAYEELIRHKTDLKKYTPSSIIVQYHYMRSFFPSVKIPQATTTAYNYFVERMAASWKEQSKYNQGMIALSLHRTQQKDVPAAILKSLKETAVQNEELGMYWKSNNRGWFWYEAPIERQALLIEAFNEIGNDTKTVNALRTWLLKHKQTNKWESTKATAEACYALLLQGNDWLVNDPEVTISLGNKIVRTTDLQQEAGTGYFQTKIPATEITPDMGKISVQVSRQNNASPQPTWGAVYWQYFEELDKITTATTPLQLKKDLFIKKNTNAGPVLQPVVDNSNLSVGDKVTVRIELKVDRDMEFVHMKDMRAAALEPVNVLSGYKYQGGLGYYESTKDASTNFFFDNLRKGTYVFEYDLFITHTGTFSNGITTIQSMYAPEFSSHSEGVRITVK